MKTFKIGEYEYTEDLFGIIHQLNPEPFEYGEDYISCYDTDQYRKNNLKLQEIRWKLLKMWTTGSKVLDYGCGRGEFAKNTPKGYQCWNYDINMPFYERDYDIYTMWDVLEHIPNLNKFFMSHHPKYILLSVPLRPINVDKMSDWRHLKPNEHLHHFDLRSLTNLMSYNDYNLMHYSFAEDEIRTPPEGFSNNILTAVFRS